MPDPPAPPPAPKPDDSKPGLSISLGNIHLTATVALLGAVVSGFYTGVSWVTHMSETTQRNTETLLDIAHKLEGINNVLQAFNETHNKSEDALNQQLFTIQQQLSQMATDYHNVDTLQRRYDRAFSTYQPQPKRR